MVRIGIDIGGTFLKAGVVTEEGKILATAARPTGFPRPVDEIIADVAGAATDAIANAGLTLDDVSFVGCGCPGTVNQQTRLIEYAGNLGFKQTPLVPELERMLGKPVEAENDANAAVLGEWKAGAAKGTKDCVCITLGTGVGGGVIANGAMIRGVNSAGGELGHTDHHLPLRAGQRRRYHRRGVPGSGVSDDRRIDWNGGRVRLPGGA